MHMDIHVFCTCAFLGSTCCWSLSADDLCCCGGEAFTLLIQGPEFIYRAQGDGRKVSVEIRSVSLLIAFCTPHTVRAQFKTSLAVVFDLLVCFFNRMTMRAALAPPVAVSQTAPRLWPSPAASSRLPLVTRICPQVSDGPGATEAILPPCPENDHQSGLTFSGEGGGSRVRQDLNLFTLMRNLGFSF